MDGVDEAPGREPSRRSEGRLVTSLPVRVFTLEYDFPATLLNLSGNGAQIAVDEDVTRRSVPPPGERVVLEWGQFQKLGRLIWQTQHIGGMTFEEVTTEEELAATKAMQEDYLAQGGKLHDMARYADEWVSGKR